MKQKNKIVQMAVLSVLIAGCDVIPEGERLLPLPATAPQSNALLIDFTGFLCVNCPMAAEEAQRLQQTYPDHLVVVAMHPKDNHFTQTTLPQYDYTCDAANVYYNAFGGTSTTPFPTGIVDMQAGWLNYSEWATAVRTSVLRPKNGRLSLTISDVDESSRRFTLTAESMLGDARVLLWLVADSVHGAQMMPDGSTNLDYTHRHMLRDAIADRTTPVNGLSYTLTDTIGGQVLPMTDYSVVGVLMERESGELIDVQQIKIMK